MAWCAGSLTLLHQLPPEGGEGLAALDISVRVGSVALKLLTHRCEASEGGPRCNQYWSRLGSKERPGRECTSRERPVASAQLQLVPIANARRNVVTGLAILARFSRTAMKPLVTVQK